jgi:CheY-like chemotaxis protein
LSRFFRTLFGSDTIARSTGAREAVASCKSTQVVAVQEQSPTPFQERLLSRLARDVQTSASVILGWASTIHRSQTCDERLMSAVRAIERNAREQNRLAENLLERSRIIAGSFTLSREWGSLVDMIRIVVDEMREVADRKGIILSDEVMDADYCLIGDQLRLLQVFRNVLSNAVRFTPRDGHVWVDLSRCGQTATILIKDDGPGIRAERLTHICDGTQDRADSLEASSEGTGLGLWVARHIVEGHNGILRVESDGRNGSAVVVTLPLGPRSASEPPRYQSAGALAATRIILVEDDDKARMLLTYTLEYYGAKVVAVASASEALQTLNSACADVVLLDLECSTIDAEALIRSIRKDPDARVAATPAAALAASALEEDPVQALSAGYQLLRKPVDPDDLVSAIFQLTTR